MNKKCNPKKDASFSIRLPRKTLDELRAMESRAHITLATMTAAILTGLLQYEQQHGELRTPFLVIPCSEWRAIADGRRK